MTSSGRRSCVANALSNRCRLEGRFLVGMTAETVRPAMVRDSLRTLLTEPHRRQMVQFTKVTTLQSQRVS